ncbi:Hypothetical protein D9617_11g009130 [Elsinoe fawcettii]|nr:Hypothetical protein D9617_11g009130 [Elsinoe fawcettii]
MFFAMMYSLLALPAQILSCLFPINVDRLPGLAQRRQSVSDYDDEFSCPTKDPLPTTQRTEFVPDGCTIYGYPSTGGILIKDATFVDMLFLSLSRTHALQRSYDVEEEDEFCRRLRQTGARLWSCREEYIETLLGMRQRAEQQRRVMVYGWPADGVGVWVLRFESEREIPEDFGRVKFAMNMEEKIQLMKEYGAKSVEDVAEVEELCDDYFILPTTDPDSWLACPQSPM